MKELGIVYLDWSYTFISKVFPISVGGMVKYERSLKLWVCWKRDVGRGGKGGGWTDGVGRGERGRGGRGDGRVDIPYNLYD